MQRDTPGRAFIAAVGKGANSKTIAAMPGRQTRGSAASSPAPKPEPLSEYELLRLENIRRNQKVLQELNIPEVKQDMKLSKRQATKKRKREAPPPAAPTRRSTRVAPEKAKSFQEEQAADQEREVNPSDPPPVVCALSVSDF